MCEWAEDNPEVAEPLVTLLSDFGLRDPYVAEMKAVILSICPQARLVDVSHEVEKFSVRMGAFVLASAAPYFPKGTVHVAVVDPGVGTKRRAIIVEAKDTFFVGPDNGLLMQAAQRQGIKHVYNIANRRYMLPSVSRTFHGRDIFAPAAAHLARGCEPSDFGSEIHDHVVPRFVKPLLTGGGLSGEVLHIDDFGNIITNIAERDLEDAGISEGSELHIKLGGKAARLKFCSAYGEAPARTLLALVGSHDFLEIAVNQSSASKRFKTEIGDIIVVTL